MQHSFLGSNTPYGFVSRFQNILRPGAGRLFILKGGSGSGKSTLMKKLAADAEERGLTAERYHCSSDPESLDGVLIKERGIAVVDGTSPHVVDTQMYGAFDEIVNLGDCIDGSRLQGESEKLQTLLAQKAACYRTAYRYLAAAGELFRDTAAGVAAAASAGIAHDAAAAVVRYLGMNSRTGEAYGGKRELFASALTPLGYVDFTRELLAVKNVAVLKNCFETAASEVLADAAEQFRLSGYYTERYLSPLEPDALLAFSVPEIEAAVVAKSFLSDVELSGGLEIDLAPLSSADIRCGILKQNLSEAQILLTFGCERMAKAASLHQEIEAVYRPVVDFQKVDEKYAYIRSYLGA